MTIKEKIQYCVLFFFNVFVFLSSCDEKCSRDARCTSSHSYETCEVVDGDGAVYQSTKLEYATYECDPGQSCMEWNDTATCVYRDMPCAEGVNATCKDSILYQCNILGYVSSITDCAESEFLNFCASDKTDARCVALDEPCNNGEERCLVRQNSTEGDETQIALKCEDGFWSADGLCPEGSICFLDQSTGQPTAVCVENDSESDFSDTDAESSSTDRMSSL
jgi:hypothetical protein